LILIFVSRAIQKKQELEDGFQRTKVRELRTPKYVSLKPIVPKIQQIKSFSARKVLALASLVLAFGLPNQSLAGGGQHWRSAHGDIHNTGNASGEKKITTDNVNRLQVKWTYLTAPDILDGSGAGANGSVTANPSVAGKYLYFTDDTGKITALNRKTGLVLWSKRFVEDISQNGEIYYSRNTPVVSKNKVVVGSAIHFLSNPCNVSQALGLPGLPADGVLGPFGFNCNKGGAYVVALDRFTGAKLWEQQVSNHPAAKISGSVTIVGNTVYVPVGGWEEEYTRRIPNIYDLSVYPAQINLLPAAQINLSAPYPCCSASGKVVALDLTTGAIKWSRDLAIGVDKNNNLAPALKAALGPKGYFGVSTYGDGPTVDMKRGNVYVATTNAYTAPPIVEACEVARRQFSKVNPTNLDLALLAAPHNLQLPQGVSTCNDLNKALQTYNEAIVALDRKTGTVKWAFYARQYDSWVHACDAPQLTVSYAIPVLVPDPLSNLQNCPNLVGPDYGFGNQPILIKNVGGTSTDLLVAGNKDGYVYALKPDTGTLVWKKRLSPGGIFGGIQFGMATDGKAIFTGVANSDNTARNINREFHSLQSFLDANFNDNPNFTTLGSLRFKTGLINDGDGAPTESRSAPADNFIPFPGPQISLQSIVPSVNGGAGYPNAYPLYVNNVKQEGQYSPFLTGQTSGPRTLWKLVNPPADVTSNCVNVFDRPINRNNPGPDVAACVVGKTGAQTSLYTLAGMVQAVSASTGDILWQRPAVDGIGATIGQSSVVAPPTVANGVVFIGYADAKGTLVGLDSKTGILKFKYNASIITDTVGTTKASGLIASAPTVVNGNVYWGIGYESLGPFNPNYPGNRVYAFELAPELESEVDAYDEIPQPVEDEDWSN
jgi:polyvinyl alcohol dehydrogenase (cytochrome)